MTIVAFIVIALALSVSDMLLLRRCAEPFPIRLSSGLAIALAIAAVQTALYLLGIAVGDFLRIESPTEATLYNRPNAYIMLGLFVIVALKMLFPYLKRKPELPVFNLTDTKSVAAMSIATGINSLLIGIGVGFTTPLAGHLHITLWPMLVLSLLLGFLGIMFGRQKVTMRPRRWTIAVCVILLGTAIATVINS